MILCVQVRHFAAAVERQTDPALTGVPLILVTYRQQRGKVLAVSSEAETAGILPGMALSKARALCPKGCFITASTNSYEQAFDHLLAALWTFTNQVEIQEIDYPQTVVAYLDLGRLKESDACALGEQIIETLRASVPGEIAVGMAAGKFPAYVASNTAEAGQVVSVAAGEEAAFVAPQSVELLPLSKAAARKLLLLCIHQIGELAAFSRSELVAQFGKPGRQLYWLAQGIDGRAVTPRRMPQGEHASRSFEHPLTDRARLDVALHYLAEELAVRLEGRVAAAHHLTLTLHFERGKDAVERLHLLQPVATARGITQALQPLIERTTARKQLIIGVEVTVMQLVSAAPRQLELLTHRPARQLLIDLTPALVERYGNRFYEAVLNERSALLPEQRFELRCVNASSPIERNIEL